MSISLGAIIQRSGMIKMLEDLSDKKMIFVSAPAGYGKSIAVRQWLDGKKCAKAFLSLDEYDNDFSGFCARFCAALYTCQPQNSALYEVLSHPAFPNAPDEFTLRAVGILSARKRAVFVVDDLHVLLDDHLIQFLMVLMQRLPKAIQIVLISRNAPPPAFQTIWKDSSFALVKAENLRFSADDISRLYKKRGKTIAPEESADILHYTGGWPIAVGALLLSEGKPSDHVLEYLDDFILPNIWERWDNRTREFMLCTAMARELPPSLCDTLAEIPDSQSLLLGLMQAGAFVSQTKDGAFHYHHLFRSFIRKKAKERGDAFLCQLLKKEGRWHLSKKDFYSAADCFIRCGSVDGIVKCFDMLEFTDRNDFVIERMLPIIKSPAIQAAANRYPSLFYLMAWAAYAEGRDKDMIRYMDSYYSRHQEIAERDPAHAHNIIYMRVFDFRVSILQLISEAAQFPVIPGVSGVQGSITMNMPLFHRGISDFSELAAEEFEPLLIGAGEQIGWLFGEEWQLLSSCLMAGLYYEQGQRDKAHIHALAAVESIQAHFPSELKFCAMSILVHTLEALGRWSESVLIMIDLSDMIEQDHAYYLSRNFNALSMRRKICAGHVRPAQNWIKSRTALSQDGVYMHSIYEAFTTARAHIAANDLEPAIILLTKLLDLARRFCRPLDIIEAQILLAVSYWGENPYFRSRAMDALGEAVTIAYPYGFTQLFLNEGAKVSNMLFFLQNSGGWQSCNCDGRRSFLNQLCLKLRDKKNIPPLVGKSEPAAAYTEKQRAVMILFCQGKSLKVIAKQMEITLPTVRSHIALIYKKLDVTNRIDAIARIKELGLAD